jgi:hypothetical protein
MAGWYVERIARLRFEDVAKPILDAVEDAKVNRSEAESAGWIDGITVAWQVYVDALAPVPDATAKSVQEDSVTK